MTIPAVAHTADFQRIVSLPRRPVPSAAELTYLASSITEILKTPAGTMSLKPIQALALYDAGTVGGLLGPIGVGEGKTLLSLLLPIALDAKRPLLLLPGGLIEKTKRERLALSQHWRIPNTIRLFSYDLLSRVNAADELEKYQPDVIVGDEIHRLKSKRAAVTRRVARYMHAHPETKFAGLSGSIMDKSLKDFAHIAVWALKSGAPVPLKSDEVEEWAEALDERSIGTRQPGALLQFANREDGTGSGAARRGFQRRLVETPGVVATVGEGERVGCSIYVRGIIHKVAPVTEQNFAKLRKEWRTPDDWELMTAVDVWRHAQELALGLHYVWSPRPPQEWRNARTDWNRFVRETISKTRTYDSELHVANACDAGKLDGSLLKRWRAIKPTYTPNVVPVWHDDSALKTCAEWMKHPGIVWTEHGFFAERLSKETGHTYYGPQGRSSDGRYIEDASSKDAIIASLHANREGRNLQHLWHRNLMVTPPTSAAWWEQTVARTHRPGQTADEVIVDVLLGCRENFDACMKAIEGAKAIRDMTGKQQKLLLADITLPSESEIDGMNAPRWVR